MCKDKKDMGLRAIMVIAYCAEKSQQTVSVDSSARNYMELGKVLMRVGE